MRQAKGLALSSSPSQAEKEKRMSTLEAHVVSDAPMGKQYAFARCPLSDRACSLVQTRAPANKQCPRHLLGQRDHSFRCSRCLWMWRFSLAVFCLLFLRGERLQERFYHLGVKLTARAPLEFCPGVGV